MAVQEGDDGMRCELRDLKIGPEMTVDAQSLFKKWADRLLDPGWDLNIVADRSLSGGYAETETIPANRRATIRYNPEHCLPEATGCHEICHILVSHLLRAAEAIARQLQGPARELAEDLILHESEETAVSLTRAFLKAYGEQA